MGVREHVRDGQSRSEHVVQFFDSDDTRQEAVARFLGEGYAAGAALILIARPLNSAALIDRLEKAGASIRRDLASGRITVLDAADTLRQISRNGSPDGPRFDEIVGALVQRVSRQGRVYAYGEMVDVLAQRADFADAALLEAFWNRLLHRVPLSLMCGYSAAHFVAAGTERALREICAAHTSVRVEAQDPLAVWLLDTTTPAAS